MNIFDAKTWRNPSLDESRALGAGVANYLAESKDLPVTADNYFWVRNQLDLATVKVTDLMSGGLLGWVDSWKLGVSLFFDIYEIDLPEDEGGSVLVAQVSTRIPL